MIYTSVIGINYVIHGFQSKQTCGLQSLFGNVQVGTRVLINYWKQWLFFNNLAQTFDATVSEMTNY